MHRLSVLHDLSFSLTHFYCVENNPRDVFRMLNISTFHVVPLSFSTLSPLQTLNLLLVFTCRSYITYLNMCHLLKFKALSFSMLGKNKTYNLTKQMFTLEDLHYNITVEMKENFPAAVVHEARSSLDKSPVHH